jgi:DNA-binding transcriptional ArsR family regulator
MKLDQAARVLGALAQPTRLAVFRALVAAPADGVAAGAMAEALGVAAPTLSFHLKELEAAGLVTRRRHGRFVHYAMEPLTVARLMDYLLRDCCQGRPDLCRPICPPTTREDLR